MRFFILFIFLVPALATAQAKRQPEPVPSAAAEMFEQLRSGDWRNWIQKAEALDYLGRYDVPNAAAPVKAILDNTHPNNQWLRGRALIAMARIDPTNAATLADTYANDPHVEVRAAAADICAELPAATATPIIEKLLADKSVQFHALAAHAHHRGAAAWEMADKMTAKVPDNSIEPAARALGWIGTEAARKRLLELARQTKSLPALLRGLEGMTAPALVPFYLDLISLPGDKLQIAEVWQALHGYPQKTIAAACREALTSEDEKQIQAIARLMSLYLKDPTLGENLQAAMEKSKDRNTLLLGLSALSCVEADRFHDVFIANLTHKDVAIRTAAVQCLAQCKKVNLYETLEKTLSDTHPAVAVAALNALQNASAEQMPRDRIVEYYTPSLLSPDATTRQAAVAALTPAVTMDNGEAALTVMRQMQEKFGTAGTTPLMKAVFRMVPEKKSAEILEAHGYVARWHVIGAFPAGFGAPKEDVDGFATVYPPEKNVDLNESIKVAYNTKSDTRFGKAVGGQEIRWAEATVANADGTLYMTKAGRSQLLMPRKNGVCYAYTEIIVPQKQEVLMKFLFNMKAQDRVWLNGVVLKLETKLNKEQGTHTKTCKATLNAGNNRVLVKVVSNDFSGAWWAPKVSSRGFSLAFTDLKGKPLKWSHK